MAGSFAGAAGEENIELKSGAIYAERSPARSTQAASKDGEPIPSRWACRWPNIVV
jgi:hypothetical protein